MADVLKRLDDIVWSRRTYTPKELSAREKCFPMTVKIMESSSGDYFYNKFSTDQVMYLYGVKEQFRFLAQDCSQNHISIPINSPITFLEPWREAEVNLTEDMALPRCIAINLKHSKHDLSQLICLTEEDEILLTVRQRGWMKYLMGLCLSNGEVSRSMETIPVDCNEIRFSVALDIRDETIDDFLQFESCLHDLVISIHQDQLGSYQGNADLIINAQPNFIEVLEEISTNNNLQIQVCDSANDKSREKKFSGKSKKSRKKKRAPSYTDINLSEVESSGYQDLTTLIDHSSDEYDYPDIDDYTYEMIDENPQLDNEYLTIYEPLSLEDAIGPNAHVKRNKDKLSTKLLSMHGDDNDDYLVPIEYETKTMKKAPSSDDDKEYLVPMIQEANSKKKEQTSSEDDKDYLVPMKQETNMKKKEQTSSEDDKDYLVPMKQETTMNKKEQITSEDNNNCLVPMKQGADTKNKKQTSLEDDEEYLIPMKQKAKVKKVIKKEKNLSEASQHQILKQDYENYLITPGHVLTKEDTHTKKNEKPLSAGRKEQQMDDKGYLAPTKHLSQGQYTGLEKDNDRQELHKQPGQDVLEILPPSYQDLQSNILVKDIISQSRKLKPIVPLPGKKDLITKSTMSVMVSGGPEAIQSKVSTQSKETVEGNVSTHSEKTIEGSKHKSDIRKSVRPVVAQKPPKVKDTTAKNMSSCITEDMKSRKIDTMKLKPPLLPKPHRK